MIYTAVLTAAWMVVPNAFAQQTKGVKQMATGQTVEAPEKSKATSTKSVKTTFAKPVKTPVAKPVKETTTKSVKAPTTQPKTVNSSTSKPASVSVKSKAGATKQTSSSPKVKMQEKVRKMPQAKSVSGNITTKQGSVFDGRNVKVKKQTKTKK